MVDCHTCDIRKAFLELARTLKSNLPCEPRVAACLPSFCAFLRNRLCAALRSITSTYLTLVYVLELAHFYQRCARTNRRTLWIVLVKRDTRK